MGLADTQKSRCRTQSARRFCRALCPDNSADKSFRIAARSHIWAQNVVTKMWLVPSVELRRFSAQRLFAYVPPQFWACAVRTKNQLGSTSLVFRTGRVVNVGSHSLPQTYQAAHRLRLALAETGQPTKFEEFRLVNMVFNTKMERDYGIDIAAIHRDYQAITEYVPAMFPGLKLYHAKGRVRVRVFDTFNIVIMGALRPARVGIIFDDVAQVADANPDFELPVPAKRFDYRNVKKQKALAGVVMRQSGTETEIEEDEEEEDDEEESCGAPEKNML